MKNLRKALALVVALAVVSVSSAAFAETINFSFNAIEGETAVVTGSYNDVAKTFTAGVTGAKDGEQTTFVILDQDAEDTNLDADDILYIDQNATGSFSGAINMTRVSDPSDNTGETKMSAVSNLPVGTYTVKLGYYNADGNFKPATGTLTISPVVVDGVKGISFNNGTSATVGTGIDLSATVTGEGTYSSEYDLSIKEGTNNCGATLNVNTGHLDAATAGTVTVVATARGTSQDGGAAKTAELEITFALPANALTSVTVSADNSSPETGATVNLTASFVDPSASGVTLNWSATGGTLTPSGSTATLTSSTEATITVTVTATTSYATKTDTIVITFADPEPQYTTIELVLGDVNGDNVADSTDATQLIAKTVGGPVKVGTSAYNIGAAVIEGFVLGDVNGDNVADSTDATQLIAKTVGGPVKVGTSKYNIGGKATLQIPIK